MTDPDTLRTEADADDTLAEELTDDNPSYSGYLTRRAAWKRYLADQEDESTDPV